MKNLPAADLVENVALALFVKLRKHVVQEQNGVFPGIREAQLPLGELEREGRRPASAPARRRCARSPVDEELQVVLVRPGEAAARLPFGAPWVSAPDAPSKAGKSSFRRGKGVLDAAHRPIERVKPLRPPEQSAWKCAAASESCLT
jgi:hypothetical protein